MILPDIKDLVKTGEGFSVIPIRKEILSDIKTPIQVLKSLKRESKNTFLFESVEGGERWGRYSFIGYDPLFTVKCNDYLIEKTDHVTGRKELIKESPEKYLKNILSEYKSPLIEGLPRFTGGLAGYIAYDYIKYTENTLKLNNDNTPGFDDFHLMLFDKLIVFDHLKQKIIIIVNIGADNPEKSYPEGVEKINEITNIITKDYSGPDYEYNLKSKFTLEFSKEEYMGKVDRIKKHIYEGDIFQAVLSNRAKASFSGDLLLSYRILRTINPSPYMFYISSDDLQIAGASPETLVHLTGDVLRTFPIAGTCPRGENERHEKELVEKLMADEKELAEHTMLVDLGRNDLGKISEIGSVEVTEYREILKFSHVIHIGSTVSSRISEKFDQVDAIGAVLPAGTLSGAPKKRACEIINEAENKKRGVYGGAVGYFDFSGNMDFCIGIRMVVKKGEFAYIQSGAGIVADSDPEREYNECAHKAGAMIRAMEEAGEK